MTQSGNKRFDRHLADTAVLAPLLIIAPYDIDELFRRFGTGLDETLAWSCRYGGRN